MVSTEDLLIRLGETNRKWGICGFTSSLYAIHDSNLPSRGEVASRAGIPAMLGEIRRYLLTIRRQHPALLARISTMTRSYGGIFGHFTVESYLARLTAAIDDHAPPLETILDDPAFGLAMPPEAVSDYIERMWGGRTFTQVEPEGQRLTKGIIGVCIRPWDQDGRPLPYHGLRHYMYYDGFHLHSWGQVFPSVEAAARWSGETGGWRAQYLITVEGRSVQRTA